jgi:hypothetical protein
MQKVTRHLMVLSILLFACANLTFAQNSVDSVRLPLTFLQKMTARTGHPSDAFTTPGKTKNSGISNAASSSGLPGIDSVVNWSDQFTSPGFDFNGNPQSVWPYTMVGNPPESGIPAFIGAPIVPVSVDLLGPDGTVASFGGVPLHFGPTPKIVDAVAESPLFVPWFYTSGIGQFDDQLMRAEFFDRIHGRFGDNGWHIDLLPKVRTARNMQIPFGSWFFATDNNGVPVAAFIEGQAFSNLLFPQTTPVDNTTPIGAAELAGEMTTRDISSFLFNNVFLYDGNINNCCVLGFHSIDIEPGDKKNGNRERVFVMDFSSWISPGSLVGGFEDITPLSHEMSEAFNNPFGINQTPWWLSTDPIFGNICQDNLEVGDVIENQSGNALFAISLQGRTYHMQNEALFSWFAFQSPSKAHLGAYSFPDETTLLALSPGPLTPGCKAAQ